MKNATFLLLGKWNQRSSIPSIPPQWQHEQRDEQAPQLPNHDLWLHLQEQSNPSFWKPTRKPATERATGYFPSFSTQEHPGCANTRSSQELKQGNQPVWPQNSSCGFPSLLWVFLQLRPQGHNPYHQGSHTVCWPPSSRNRKHFHLAACYMAGHLVMDVMSYVLVGWLSQAWVTKPNDALQENVPQCTQGQTEIIVLSIWVGLFKMDFSKKRCQIHPSSVSWTATICRAWC